MYIYRILIGSYIRTYIRTRMYVHKFMCMHAYIYIHIYYEDIIFQVYVVAYMPTGIYYRIIVYRQVY